MHLIGDALLKGDGSVCGAVLDAEAGAIHGHLNHIFVVVCQPPATHPDRAPDPTNLHLTQPRSRANVPAGPSRAGAC